MPTRMTSPAIARRDVNGLAVIGPTRFDVLGIRFHSDPGGDGGNPTVNPDEFLPGDADLSDDDFKAKRGFPRKTKKDDMAPDERENYWRYEAKKQQHGAEELRRDNARWIALGTFDTVSQTISDADQARRSALTDQQKAAEDATTAGDAAGFARAQGLYLRPAVHAILVAATKRADESDEDAATRVSGVLDVLDVTKFVTATGELDASKVGSFAQSLAPKDSNGGAPSGDPIADALRRGETTPNGHGGSVAAMEAVFYDRLKPSK